MTNPIKALWQRCERLYNSNRTPLLLSLQESDGVSVNLLLLALYLDQHHLLLPQATWYELNQHAEQFERRILRPYRLRRKQLKGLSSPCAYQNILMLELELERLLQQQLASLLPQSIVQGNANSQQKAGRTNNLNRYAHTRDLSLAQLTPIYSIN
ncbi:DUF2390 domain-containing protein [Motilimonas sp. KMU-193]|uniref:DUF2390 domain-containing protein n=1 Tax=Motilimonas sp. KMU-193 TaxID=3388668 RepID=UPI00396AFE51